MATVAMQSFHMPKYPINIKASILPTTSFQLLEPNQAKGSDAAIEFLKKHEGVWSKWVSSAAAKKIKAGL